MYDTPPGPQPPSYYSNHIICVGAVYIDTILTVPSLPPEDTKSRATSLLKHRGGNPSNTLEVLSQLLFHDPYPASLFRTTDLHLITVLPAWGSAATEFVKDSLPEVCERGFIYRSGHQEAASSYIIKSQATLSRTSVSINPLPEMTVQEFQDRLRQSVGGEEECCIHFEGREPDVLLECVEWVRKEYKDVRISVECEKPERRGVEGVAGLADVVFYSRLWAESHGFEDAATFLQARIPNTKPEALLCCTWGAGGAMAVRKGGEDVWASVEAWKGEGEVIDTIGAGDTFIAGMLFAVNNHADWSLQEKLEFANRLAGRKVLQEGFGELGKGMW